MSTNIFKCEPFDAILDASTAGASIAVIESVDVSFDSFTFGASLTNSFETEFKTWDGDDVISSFVTPGAFYMGGEIAISPSTFSLPEVLELSGEAKQMVGMDVDSDEIESILSSLSATSSAGMAELLELLTTVDFSVLTDLDLYVTFSFSAVGSTTSIDSNSTISLAVPDSDAFEIGSASLYGTTYSVTSGDDNLSPGLYLYTTASAKSVMEGLVSYAVSFTGSILDSFSDFLTVAADELVDSVVDGDFKFALAYKDTDQLNFLISVPVSIALVESVTIQCRIEIGNASFLCSVSTSLDTKIFGAIASAVDDGYMWVARSLDNFEDDIESTGKEILAAGLSTLGDAEGAVGSAFSSVTVAATAAAIEAGDIALETLGDVGYELSAWGAKADKTFENVMDDIEDTIVKSVSEIGEDAVSDINDLEKDYEDAKSALEDAVEDIVSQLGCTVDAAVSTLQGKSVDCSVASSIMDILESVERDAEKACDKVIEIFEDVAQDISDAYEAAEQAVYFGEETKYKYSVTSSEQSNSDENTGCPYYDYTKVTKEYTRDCAGYFCEDWVLERTLEEDLGTKPLDDCVNSTMVTLSSALDLGDDLNSTESDYDTAETYNETCEASKSITADDLTSNGLICTTTVDSISIFKESSEFYVPVSISCTVPVIDMDGSFSDSASVTKSLDVAVTTSGLDSSAVDDLKDEVVSKLVSKISKNCDSDSFGVSDGDDKFEIDYSLVDPEIDTFY